MSRHTTIAAPLTAPLTAAGRVAPFSLSSVTRAFWRRFTLAWQIRSERCMLANVSDEALRDMGIERAQATAESSRRMFDLPANRQ